MRDKIRPAHPLPH